MSACWFACQQADNSISSLHCGRRVRQSHICSKAPPHSGNAYFQLCYIDCLFVCLYLLTVLLFDHYISLFLSLFFSSPFSIKSHKGDSAFLCLIMSFMRKEDARFRSSPYLCLHAILVFNSQIAGSGCICSMLTGFWEF